MSEDNFLYTPLEPSISLDAPIARVLERAGILEKCSTMPGCDKYHLVDGLDWTKIREAVKPALLACSCFGLCSCKRGTK